MTEENSFNPRSHKGEIRAQIAQTLLAAIAAADVIALIARSADFYGPQVQTSIPQRLGFDALAQHTTPSCLMNNSVAHAFTFTPDAASALVQLAHSDTV